MVKIYFNEVITTQHFISAVDALATLTSNKVSLLRSEGYQKHFPKMTDV